jgi:hypothetical protein
MTRYLAGIVGLFVIATGSANPPDPTSLIASPEQTARARELVRQLGNDAYRDRDRAERELRRMGRFAITALAEGVASPDPEVRVRCEALLPLAAADDVAARLAVFLTDPDGPHELPGWAEFKAAAGDDSSARALFAAAAKNPDNHAILRAFGRPADQLDRSLVARRRQVHQRRLRSPIDWETPIGLADHAVILLAESLATNRTGIPGTGPGPDQYNVASGYYEPTFRDAQAGRGRLGPAFRRLAIRWLESREGDGLGASMDFARNVQIGNEVVARIATRVVAVTKWPGAKIYAILYLAGFGTKEDLPTVAGLLADATVVDMKGWSAPPPDDVQLRDVALFAAVQLTDQDPRDYSFKPAPDTVSGMFGRSNPRPLRFWPAGLGADGKREAAFKKWAAWAAKHLPAGKP